MILGLAPMDGITDSAFRLIVQSVFQKYNKNHELYFWTEFMNADGYCSRPRKLIRHMMTVQTEFPTIAQIYGWNEETLIKTAVDLEKKYSDIFFGIELNIWCPSPKVMAGWGGSGMMKDKQNTLKIIQNIKKNISLPFTIKTRSWLNFDDQKDQMDFIVQASKFCDMISVHARYFKQAHSWDVDWDFLYELKKNIKPNCKIIWNGWIKSFQDAENKKNNLDWIMIWQSAIWNPRIFTDHEPTLEDRLEIILEHLDIVVSCEVYFSEHSQIDFYEKNILLSSDYKLTMPTLKIIQDYKKNIDPNLNYRSVLEFRKYLFNYVKWIPESKDFKVKVSQITDYLELKNEILTFFNSKIQ